MDPLILASITVLIAVIAAIIYFLKFHNSQEGGEVGNVEPQRNVVANVPRGVAAPAVQGVRRRGRAGAGRNRRQNQESDSEGSDEEMFDSGLHTDDKSIGAKKARKLEEKAAKKAQREAEVEEREEKKKQHERLEKQRKAEEKKKEAEEALKLNEEQKLKEEREKQEHEEYLRLKKEFCVEGEGEDAEEEDTTQSLQQFITYIKETKVVMLEDLASHFKLKTQDAIDRIKTLQEDGTLSGVIDDRGKFVYITAQEYEAVARFIKQRGRVSITELAESMNRLIDLSPDSTKLNVVAENPSAISISS